MSELCRAPARFLLHKTYSQLSTVARTRLRVWHSCQADARILSNLADTRLAGKKAREL